MHDARPSNPAEWSLPPTGARIVDKPVFGMVIMGRGAANPKGAEATFLAALHAIRRAFDAHSTPFAVRSTRPGASVS